MILFDGVHLATDGDLAELRAAGRQLGLRDEWLRDHPRHPHYDVWGRPAKRAAALFGICSTRGLLRRLKEVRTIP